MSYKINGLILLLLFSVLKISNAQSKYYKQILPELIIKNQNLMLVIDSALNSERKCKYYSDTLFLLIDVQVFNEKDTTIQIESINDKNVALEINPKGYINFLSHIIFIYGHSIQSLYTKSSRTSKFLYEKTKHVLNDDSFSVWVYKYINDNFKLINKHSFCN